MFAKRKIRDIFLEIIPVTFGVLIALWVNGTKQNDKDKRFKDDLVYSIYKELIHNIKGLEKNTIHHDTILKNFIDSRKNNNEKVLDVISKTKGFRFTEMITISSYILETEKMMLFDHPTIMKISELYKVYKIFKTRQMKILSLLYKKLLSNSREVKMMLYYIITDFVHEEKKLLHICKDTELFLREKYTWQLKLRNMIDEIKSL